MKCSFEKNVGTTDRIVRLVVGLALLSLFVVLEGAARWLGLIGVVVLLTAAFSFCPAYAMACCNTCCGTGKKGDKDKGKECCDDTCDMPEDKASG